MVTEQTHKPERATEDKPDEPAIVSLAHQCLESHFHFRHHCQTICIKWTGDRLVLSGQLPSFHLKQLAQEALRGLDVTVVNQIEVVCSNGLSSSQGATLPK